MSMIHGKVLELDPLDGLSPCHIVRTPDNIVRVPYMASGPATLPVFGTPCQSFGGPPGTCGNSKTRSENTTDIAMDAPAPAESPRRRWSRKCQ